MNPYLRDVFTALLMDLCFKLILTPLNISPFLSASRVMIALSREMCVS